MVGGGYGGGGPGVSVATGVVACVIAGGGVELSVGAGVCAGGVCVVDLCGAVVAGCCGVLSAGTVGDGVAVVTCLVLGGG